MKNKFIYKNISKIKGIVAFSALMQISGSCGGLASSRRASGVLFTPVQHGNSFADPSIKGPTQLRSFSIKNGHDLYTDEKGQDFIRMNGQWYLADLSKDLESKEESKEESKSSDNGNSLDTDAELLATQSSSKRPWVKQVNGYNVLYRMGKNQGWKDLKDIPNSPSLFTGHKETFLSTSLDYCLSYYDADLVKEGLSYKKNDSIAYDTLYTLSLSDSAMERLEKLGYTSDANALKQSIACSMEDDSKINQIRISKLGSKPSKDVRIEAAGALDSKNANIKSNLSGIHFKGERGYVTVGLGSNEGYGIQVIKDMLKDPDQAKMSFVQLGQDTDLAELSPLGAEIRNSKVEKKDNKESLHNAKNKSKNVAKAHSDDLANANADKNTKKGNKKGKKGRK